MQLNKNELKYQSSETHIPSYDCPYPIPNDLNVRYFTI